MMGLYEIGTGKTGESYERAYVWAESETRAAELFQKRNPESKGLRPQLLFFGNAESFSTKVSDSGFERN